MTHAEFLAEAKQRFGDSALDIAFTCPNCGDVAAISEFAPEHRDRAGQECIGRTLGALNAGYNGRGCDWTAYGLFCGPWTVVLPSGRDLHIFPLADAKAPAVTP
jgi:hypothetical protein